MNEDEFLRPARSSCNSRQGRRYGWPLAVAAVLLCVLGPRAHADGSVTISNDVDEGLTCFKITTPSATYYYDKAGAGLTSMLDRDGVDWIGFHPRGTPGIANGDAGWYRGVPNMSTEFGHPGNTGAKSTTPDPKGVGLPKATVRSVKGDWKVEWEFFPTYAKMTVQSVAGAYWLLYEGTPGGRVTGDTCGRSGGGRGSCDHAWEEDLGATAGAHGGSTAEWVYFADSDLQRSFLLVHRDDKLTDRYYLRESMTVFGFGRRSPTLMERLMRVFGVAPDLALMREVPQVLVIGFVESVNESVLRQHLATLQRDL